MDWFKEGDRNTKFFHTIVKGRRSRLKVNRIQNDAGERLEQEEEIAVAAIDFYNRQFTKQAESKDFEILKEVPVVVTNERNEGLNTIPTVDEVRSAVKELNRNSAGGPNGMTGAFYQQAWDIIGGAIHRMVIAFFGGAELPRLVTHTNLVLHSK